MLSGKTIAVVGAGGLLGMEIVKAALASGANVVAFDRSIDALGELASRTVTPQLLLHQGDIASADSIRDCLAKVTAAFGVLDGAVNAAYPRNAAYGASFLDVTYDSFCENVSLHLGGYFLFMQECVRYAIDRDVEFSLVNLSSIYGSIVPRFGIYEGTAMTMPVEYAATKAGLEHLTRYVNAFAKRSKFRANCVSPGGIEAGQPPSFLAKYRQHSSTRGMLSPGDITGSILFLLSDQSRFVVGQNVVVDDGFSL